MSVTRDADSRRTETPNAVMTTLASSTQGGSEIAVWRVEMAPEASGPPHIFDTEQVWTVLGGGARILLAGEEIAVATGDTVIMPADTLRQVFADTEHEWFLTRAVSHWASDGYASAEITLWDADRRLVAYATQLMLIRFPEPGSLGMPAS